MILPHGELYKWAAGHWFRRKQLWRLAIVAEFGAGVHTRATKESTTRFSPALSNWMVSLLPSTWLTSP